MTVVNSLVAVPHVNRCEALIGRTIDIYENVSNYVIGENEH